MPVVLITGINGQDGAYLAEFLLANGYEVHGMIRRKADINTWRLDELGITKKITFHYGDVTDSHSIFRIFYDIESEPFEVYNLAAQSFVTTSFYTPASTFEINATGAINVLEAVRKVCEKRGKDYVQFYQASTSEMFGLTDVEAQYEGTKFHPRSPYGVAKLAAHWATINYRETYGLHACSGILFNHESPLRGKEFVTSKVTIGVVDILEGKADKIKLGNIEAIRDWGYAGDFVQAMWLMLQKDLAEDFVVATGESHTVEEMCQVAFSHVGLDYNYHIEIDPKLFRPCEVPVLKGNATKARFKLGWKPVHSFEWIIKNMVDKELERRGLKNERIAVDR